MKVKPEPKDKAESIETQIRREFDLSNKVLFCPVSEQNLFLLDEYYFYLADKRLFLRMYEWDWLFATLQEEKRWFYSVAFGRKYHNSLT